MPLTEKGEKIKGAMEENYGAGKGEEVFYASKNKGTITGVDDSAFGAFAMGANPNTKADGKKRADWEDLGPGATLAEKEALAKRTQGLLHGGTGEVPAGKKPDRPYDYYGGYDSKSDASPLARAEAALDEQKLMDAADAHADALAARLDAWERKMVRNGERD